MTLIKMVTPLGEEHGLLSTIANSSKDNDFKHMSPETKEKAKKLKKEESRMVKARYMNHQESDYGKLEKPYCRWAGDPIRMYKFLSGYEYEIPLGLVNEVNSNKLAKRSQVLDDKGNVSMKDGAPKTIHEFIPIGF